MLAPVVRRLSNRDRHILQLRFFDGLTQREIADDIGVTQMQVSRLLSRIFRDMREDLGPRRTSRARPAKMADRATSCAGTWHTRRAGKVCHDHDPGQRRSSPRSAAI